MKHLLRFVAVLVAVLLVLPPAVAEGICLLAQNQLTAMECCSSLDHISAPDTAAPSLLPQSCDEGCCTVAPPSPAAPTVPDKFTADPPTISASQAHADIPLDLPRHFNSVAFAAPGPTHDLPVLLQTFRI